MKQKLDAEADARLQRHIKKGTFEDKIEEILRNGARTVKDIAYLEAVSRRDKQMQREMS